MLTPIIKRPGGKYKEFDYIKHMIPTYNRYVEPFFGGGGVFFHLQPQKAIINDICDDLIDLYKLVKREDKDFVYHIKLYVKSWIEMGNFVNYFMKDCTSLYNKLSLAKIDEKDAKDAIEKLISTNSSYIKNFFDADLIVDYDNFTRQLIRNLSGKIIRTNKLEQKKGKLPNGDLEKNIETGFRSGLYMHFRDLMNYASDYELSKPKEIANYYFIREFCYACMFRYNKQGHFNIPYGGIAYNDKNFGKKVDYLLSNDVAELFSGTEILSTDFSEILNNSVLNEYDFVFLDPPYDTEFDDYHGDVFTRKDQERLAECLYKLDAKFLLVIKNTEFIHQLYNNKGFNIDTFDKKYLVNIKGRNNQDVEHLIIYNYN